MPDGQTRIDGSIRIDDLATLSLSRVAATAQVVTRTPARIARASEDFCLVSIQTAGTGRLTQDGRVAVLRPGDFALYDSTRPYQLRFDGDFAQFVLMLPGPTLRSQVADTEQLTARPVPGLRGAGHLLISMIGSLARDVDTLEPESAEAVARSVENILVAGLRTLPGSGGARTPVPAEAHRDSVRAYIRAQVRDPGLSVAGIAQALHLSVSSVHRSFTGEPCTVMEEVWAVRLDAVKAQLCDPTQDGRTVSQLAFAWGFNDAAHFSRAFRARFGCAARDLRAARRPPRRLGS